MTSSYDKHPVFVLGMGFPALGVVHSLAPRGVPCWVCDPYRQIAAWSRHARYWRVPDPRLDELGMIARLRELARKVGGRPVLVPTDDHYAQTLARFRGEFEPEMIACVAASDTVELLVHKRRFSEWARDKGIRAPITAAASGPADAITPPLVVKPINKSNFRVVARDLPRGSTAADLRFTLIRDVAGWNAFREQNAANLEHFVVQEFIEGTTADMYSIGVYADRESRLTGMFVGRKIRGYPAQYGNTKLGQNDTAPDQVLAEIEGIVRDLRYSGIAEFEYRRVPSSGEFRLIEVNPRCWSWIGATAESAADIPWIAYRDLIGAPVDTAVDNHDPGDLKYVQIMSDMSNVFIRYRWDHPAWVMNPRAWWKSLRARRLVVAEFNRGDWPIALCCLWLLVSSGLSFFSKRFAAE